MVNGKLSCWWLTYPSEKYEFVSWDDYSQLIWKNKSHVPNDQPGLLGVFNYAQHPPWIALTAFPRFPSTLKRDIDWHV